jgi:putative transposase
LVTEANFPERLGGVVLVSEGMEKVPDLRLIWVDQGYSGEKFSDSIAQLNQAKVEVVKRKKKNLKFCLDVG